VSFSEILMAPFWLSIKDDSEDIGSSTKPDRFGTPQCEVGCQNLISLVLRAFKETVVTLTPNVKLINGLTVARNGVARVATGISRIAR